MEKNKLINMKGVDFIIMAAIGLMFTLQGFEVICLGKKPEVSETQKMAKWQKAQSFFRWGGLAIFICGILLWLFSN